VFSAALMSAIAWVFVACCCSILVIWPVIMLLSL
jgi:hypothetical protein